MHDGQPSAFLGIQILRHVGVARKNDFPVKAADLIRDLIDDRLGLFRAERAVDEIVLHVYDDEIVLHAVRSLQSVYITYLIRIVSAHSFPIVPR